MKRAGAKVLLVGMQVPPNYGADYSNRFTALFAKVAKAHKAALVPFLPWLAAFLHDANVRNRVAFLQRGHSTDERHDARFWRTDLVDRATNSQFARNPYVRAVSDAFLYVLSFRFARPVGRQLAAAAGAGVRKVRRRRG